jgi:NADPH-dependent 7-cyano-7-deazaguanine reductase QueF
MYWCWHSLYVNQIHRIHSAEATDRCRMTNRCDFGHLIVHANYCVQYSERELYEQLKSFETLFDVKRARDRCIDR